MKTTRAGLETALAALLRRRWLAFAVFSVALAAAVSFARSLPNLYQSTATVLVERAAATDRADDVDARLQSIRHEILSRARLAGLISRFDLYPKLREELSQEAVVERMRRDVWIDASRSELPYGRGGTIAFSVRYRGRDPQTVALVANALASSYIEGDSRLRERQTSGAASVLHGQLEEVKARLATQEAGIADFKRANPGALPQQAESNMAALERLNAQLPRVSDARIQAAERRAALLQEAEAPPKGEAQDADRARLERLNQELIELRTRFSDRYPDVIHKQAEIADLSAIVAKKPAVDRTSRQLEQVDREIRVLQAEEARLRSESASYRRRLEGAPWREQEYQALSRDYATTRDFYDSLLKRYEEAQLAESREGGLQAGRLRLLDPAVPATAPVAPNRLNLAGFGLMAALGMTLLAVTLAERLDTSFHSADELRDYTRVPIIARIPRLTNESLLEQERSQRRWKAALATLCIAIGVICTVRASQLLARGNEGVVMLLAPRGRS